MLDDLSHPLEGFSAGHGPVGKGTRSRVLFGMVLSQAMAEAFFYDDENRRIAARRFLLEDAEDFFWVCDLAGVDGEKLRAHLWACERGEVSIP
jgi:hypothetical protein